MLKTVRFSPTLALFLICEVLSSSAFGWEVGALEATVPETDYNSNIFVEQQTECMSSTDLRNALTDILNTREESKFMIITVVVTPGIDKSLAVLRVVERETGEILLERRLSIAPDECTNAHLALQAMLEQFLTGFPMEKWKVRQTELHPLPPPVIQKEQIVVEKEISPLSWLLLFGVDSRWPVPNGDLELMLGMDTGGKRRGIYSGFALRIGWPRPLGEGRYLETAGLLALGFRGSPRDTLDIRVELRTGTLLINGLGYEENYHQWLLMLEMQLSFLWQTGGIRIGPEIAATPLFHSVYTESGEKENLPWIRVGLLLCISLGKSVLK